MKSATSITYPLLRVARRVALDSESSALELFFIDYKCVNVALLKDVSTCYCTYHHWVAPRESSWDAGLETHPTFLSNFLHLHHHQRTTRLPVPHRGGRPAQQRPPLRPKSPFVGRHSPRPHQTWSLFRWHCWCWCFLRSW